MKKLFLIAALLLTGVLFNSQAVLALQAGGDGSNYAALQETAVFFNNSGTTLSAGQVVVLDTNGAGVTAGTTLGAYVEIVGSADSVLVVGVVKSRTSLDQTPVVVVTEGPVDTQCADSSDAVTINTAVGTTTIGDGGGTAPANAGGLCGGGTNLGIALESGGGTDNEELFVWVSPTGGD